MLNVIEIYNHQLTRVSLLILTHRLLLLIWGIKHFHWIVEDWQHVAWSDEYLQHFQIDDQVCMWRRPHKTMKSACQQGVLHVSGSSLMVLRMQKAYKWNWSLPWLVWHQRSYCRQFAPIYSLSYFWWWWFILVR